MKTTEPTCKVDANGDKAWYLNGKYITDNPLVWMVMQYENN